MTIGQNIKRLRRNADMTQEELAEMLSISSQAVSRWETDSAMPDISLLPMIANIFDVTTDSLLGVDISNKEAHIKSIIEEAQETGKSGHISRAAEIIRNGIARYPNSYELLSELQEYLYILSKHSPDKEKAVIRKEIISLGEKVIANCMDNQIRNRVMTILCYTYNKVGEKEKAEKIALSMPNIYESGNVLRTHIETGDRQYEAKRYLIVTLISMAVTELSKLNTKLDNGDWALSDDEQIIIYQKALSLIDVLCEDNDYGEYILNVSDLYRNIAAVFSRKNDIAKSLEYLKKAVTINVSFDNSYKPTQVHTSLLLRNDIYDDFFCTDTNNASLSLLIDINNNEDFNAVKKEAGFADLCNELKKAAGNRN